MRLALRVAPRAEREIREAATWWRANRPAAPDLFRQELSRAFELVTSEPAAGPRARDTALSGVRRLHLSRIRYHIYYRVKADELEVLAFWHSSRGASPEL